MNNNIILNEEQQYVFNCMINGKNILLTGPGGCGKSAIIKLFYKKYKNSKNIALTSTTGTSAIILGGTTLYSYLGIGLGNKSTDLLVKNILKKQYIKKRWKTLDVLIIDEISMLSPELFDKLEDIARVIRTNNIFFGGIQLILSGDFLQIPCVNNNKFCFESEKWEIGIDEVISLKKIIRQKNDNLFQKCLNNIRLGIIDEETKKLLSSRVGVKLNNRDGIIPTKLFPLNIDVDEINEKELEKLSNQEFLEYEMQYINVKNDSSKQHMKKNCLAKETLLLTENAQVMLLINLDIENGLVNGSRGIIKKFVNDLPLVKFINGVERIIDYNTWEFDYEKNIQKIIQLPLSLAYAFSIHKSQGSTLDYVEIDLRNIFDYGQAYVEFYKNC
jgi:ATP-dependent DNA helicase PIF1